MKTVSLSLAAVLAAMAFTAPAAAQDFQGPFIGMQAGFGQNKLRNPTTDLGMLALDTSQDHAVVGGFAGYDHQFGKFVLGAEAGFNFGIEDTIEGGTAANPITVDPKRSFDLTARAGYVVTPRVLVYARGGYTNERIRTTRGTGAAALTASEDRDGWQVGGGTEYKISDHVSARIEYRYADLSEGDNKYDRHQVLTGISYRF